MIFLVLIVGCSKSNQTNIPVTGEMPAISGEGTEDAGDVVRKLMTVYDIHENDPCETVESSFCPEGLGDYYSTLVDSVAATYYKPSSTYYNYVLVCDTQYRWSASWGSYPRVRLYRLTTADEPTSTDYATIPGTDLKDPDGCDLIAVGNYLYAFVADSDEPEVLLYYWTLNADGTLSNSTPTYGRAFSHDNMNHAQGIAATITEDSSHYDLFVCSPKDNDIFIFDEGGNKNFEINIAPDQPVDVCITRYGNNNWIAYVAVRDSDSGFNDSIRCIKWTGSTYEYSHDAVDNDGDDDDDDKFPFIMSLSVLKAAVDSGNEHDTGTVCVLMGDHHDYRSYLLRQLDFGSTYNTYYKFFDDFTTTNYEVEVDGGMASESLAICRQYYSAGGGNYYQGYHYIFSDRDPDLNYSPGNNVLVFNNNES